MTGIVLCGFKNKDRPPKQAILRVKLKLARTVDRIADWKLKLCLSAQCCHKILVAY